MFGNGYKYYEIFCNFLVGYMRSMYNKNIMEEREDLYLRKP